MFLEDALHGLRQGRKIRRHNWSPSSYAQLALDQRRILCWINHSVTYPLHVAPEDLLANDWEFYAELPANLLPKPDQYKIYHYADGCLIAPSHNRVGKWIARWADRTRLQGDNDQLSYFDTPEEAAKALFEGGEGPAREPKESA